MNNSTNQKQSLRNPATSSKRSASNPIPQPHIDVEKVNAVELSQPNATSAGNPKKQIVDIPTATSAIQQATSTLAVQSNSVETLADLWISELVEPGQSTPNLAKQSQSSKGQTQADDNNSITEKTPAPDATNASDLAEILDGRTNGQYEKLTSLINELIHIQLNAEKVRSDSAHAGPPSPHVELGKASAEKPSDSSAAPAATANSMPQVKEHTAATLQASSTEMVVVPGEVTVTETETDQVASEVASEVATEEQLVSIATQRFQWEGVTTSLMIQNQSLKQLIDATCESGFRNSAIGVTSLMRFEGRTTIATTLARIAANTGKKVLLIDAEFHHPECSKKTGADSKIGWQDLLDNEKSIDEVLVKDADSSITLMPLRAEPSMVGKAKRLAKMLPTILATTSEDYDVTIIDCEPLELMMTRYESEELPMAVGAFVYDGKLLSDEQRQESRALLTDKNPNLVAMIQNFTR